MVASKEIIYYTLFDAFSLLEREGAYHAIEHSLDPIFSDYLSIVCAEIEKTAQCQLSDFESKFDKEKIEQIWNDTLDRLEKENGWFIMDIDEETLAAMDEAAKEAENKYILRCEQENKG